MIAGDTEKNNSRCSLVISNHPTRLDWMFLWSWVMRYGRMRNLKVILKESLRKLPG